MIITQSKLSELSKSSRANIAQHVKKGNLQIDADKKIDTENQINQNWMRSRGIDPITLKTSVGMQADNIRKSKIKNPNGHEGSTKKKVETIKKVKPSEIEKIELPELNQQSPILTTDFEALTGLPERLSNLTLKQLCLQYGSQMQLKGYVDILNSLMSAMKRDVDIQEKRRALIEKDFVSAHLFQFLDVMINQIFDYPESAIDEFIAEIKADEKKARLKIPEKMRKDFSKIINEAKKNINRQIKKLNERHGEENEMDKSN
jgi:hypothetical protein